MSALGEGTFGVVRLERDGGAVFACKRYKNYADEDGITVEVVRETLLLPVCQHPRILQLFDVRDGLLMLEPMDCSLRTAMKRRGGVFTRGEALDVMRQVYAALAALHAQYVMHRDVNISNCLLNTKSGVVKVADFGGARFYDPDVTDDPKVIERCYTYNSGTLPYRAPEILLGQPNYGPGVDVWSAGCMHWELRKNVPLFNGDTSQWSQMVVIFQKRGRPVEATWPGVSQLPHYGDHIPAFCEAALPLPRFELDDVEERECVERATAWPCTRASADEMQALCASLLQVPVATRRGDGVGQWMRDKWDAVVQIPTDKWDAAGEWMLCLLQRAGADFPATEKFAVWFFKDAVRHDLVKDTPLRVVAAVCASLAFKLNEVQLLSFDDLSFEARCTPEVLCKTERRLFKAFARHTTVSFGAGLAGTKRKIPEEQVID